MRSVERPSRFPFTPGILAALLGVAPDRRAALEHALGARPIIPMVVVLVAIRCKRVLGKVAASLAGGARRIIGGSSSRDGGTVGPERLPNAAASAGARGEAREPLLPHAVTDGSFPRLIFQTWKSKVSMPANYARWSASLRGMNPGFEYFLWDDADNRRFIEKYYPWFLPVYDAYPREIYRADAVRYFFLYQFGGLYADMDTECLRSVERLFESGDVWLGRMGDDPDFSHSIPNAIMASRPLQEFWLLVIHLLVENARTPGDAESMTDKGPEALTGPILLKNAYDTYLLSDRNAVCEMIQSIAMRLPDNLQPRPGTSRVELLAPAIWYPIDWSNMIHLRLSSQVVDFNVALGERTKRWLFPRSFLVTYWTHCWKPTRGK